TFATLDQIAQLAVGQDLIHAAASVSWRSAQNVALLVMARPRGSSPESRKFSRSKRRFSRSSLLVAGAPCRLVSEGGGAVWIKPRQRWTIRPGSRLEGRPLGRNAPPRRTAY